MTCDLFEDIESGAELRIECGHDNRGRLILIFGQFVKVQNGNAVVFSEGVYIVVSCVCVLRVTVLE